METPTDPLSDMTETMRRITIETTFNPMEQSMCMVLCVSCARIAIILMPKNRVMAMGEHTVAKGNVVPIVCKACPSLHPRHKGPSINRILIESVPTVRAVAGWMGVSASVLSERSSLSVMSHEVVGSAIRGGCQILGVIMVETVSGEMSMPKPIFTFAPTCFI